MRKQEQALTKKYEEALRMVAGMPDALMECSSLADVVASSIRDEINMPEQTYHSLQFLVRRLNELYELFDKYVMPEELEHDKSDKECGSTIEREHIV